MSSMIKNTYSFIINAKGVSIFMSNFLIARFVHNLWDSERDSDNIL